MSDGDGMDPAALAAEASGAAETAADKMGDAAGGSPFEAAAEEATDEAPGLVEILMSTEPDESPADYPDLPPWTAHFVIGGKKCLNAMSTREIDKGTPAALNFVQGGLGFATSARDQGSKGGPSRSSRDDGDGGDHGVNIHTDA